MNKTMLSYSLTCSKNTESKVARTKNGRIMLLSKYAVCNSKIWKFIKEEAACGLLSSLGIKAHLSKIPFVLEVLIS